MKKCGYIRIGSGVLLLIFLISGCRKDSEIKSNIPTIALGDATSVKRTSATLMAQCQIRSGTEIESYGFRVGKTSDMSGAEEIVCADMSPDGFFSCTLNDLTKDETYYYDAYVTGPVQGSILRSAFKGFTTKVESEPNIVDIRQEGNFLKARVEDDGGSEIKNVGFCWSTEHSPEVFGDSQTAEELQSDGTFSISIPESLSLWTNYYIRGFAYNKLIGYSEELEVYLTEKREIEINPNSLIVTSEGGIVKFGVHHNVEYTVESDSDWLTVEATKAGVTDSVTLSISVNESDYPREGMVTVISEDRSIVRQVRVHQNIKSFITDLHFKAYLVENFDTDKDGEISKNEALNVNSIQVCTDNITSLEGILFFKNLTSLSAVGSGGYKKKGNYSHAYGNQETFDTSKEGLQVTGLLTSLDVSELKNLRYLSVNRNCLNQLILDEAISLVNIDASFTLLTSVSLNKFDDLSYLNVGCTELSEIDVSNNLNLRNVACSCSDITALNVGNNKQLTSLSCDSNQLTTLDVSNNPQLNYLSCSSNQLTSLDVGNNKQLTSLSCDSNQLTTLDVSNNPQLTFLRCSSNQLTSLDLGNNKQLTSLSCSSNQLTTLDVSNNPQLTQLWCDSNQLTTLDVSNNLKMSLLDCRWNPHLTDLWLKTGQVINELSYDYNITTIRYK